MKILKILGIVVAVHLFAFMFVFAVPGCRSIRRHSPGATDTAPAPAPATVNYPGASGPAYAPPPGTESLSITDTDLNPAAASTDNTVSFPSSPITPGVRYNPTRPGTPVAQALQTEPVGDVTPASTYTVAKGDSLWTVARKHGISTAELAAANNLAPGASVRLGQRLIIPGKTVAPMSTAPAAGVEGETLVYKVKAGETLGQIARRSGTTVAVIKSLNRLTVDTVRAGQELTLPAGPASAAALATSVEPAPTAKANLANSARHTVRAGETLGQIARRYGVPLREIAAANNISDPLKLRANQEIIIPNVAGKTGASTAAQKDTQKAPPPPAIEPEPAPIAPAGPIAPASDASPIIAPANDPAPPVIQVDDSSPITAPKN